MLTRRTFGAAAAGLLATPAILRAQEAGPLTFYYPIAVGGPLQAIVDGYCADYKKETGIDVNPVYAGDYSQTLIKTQAAIRAGQGPQFAVLLAAEMHSLQADDILVPLDEIGLDSDGRKWMQGFYPAFLANSEVDGKLWSVPFQRSTAVAYYNKQAFEQAGLDPAEFPTDWAGLVQAAEKLTTRDGNRVSRWGFKLASDLGNAQWTFGALANQAGATLMNQAGTATAFTDPKAITAMSYWVDLSKKDSVTPAGETAWSSLSPDFLEGNAAIIQHTTGNLTNLRTKAQFPVGVAGLPGQASPHTVVGGGNIYFFKNASAPQRTAALKFVRWLTEPARAADWSIRTGYIASRPEAYDTPALKAYVEKVPEAGVAKQFLPVATGELSTFENQRIYKTLTDNVQAALSGTKSPSAAMEQTQADAERLLKPFARG